MGKYHPHNVIHVVSLPWLSQHQWESSKYCWYIDRMDISKPEKNAPTNPMLKFVGNFPHACTHYVSRRVSNSYCMWVWSVTILSFKLSDIDSTTYGHVITVSLYIMFWISYLRHRGRHYVWVIIIMMICDIKWAGRSRSKHQFSVMVFRISRCR